MSLKLISQIYDYDSDDDKPGSDIKDKENELGVSNGTGFGIIKNTKKLETNNGKKFKLVPNSSSRKKKKADPKEDNEDDNQIPQPKNKYSTAQKNSSKAKKATQSDLIHKLENYENDVKTHPDLTMPLPFTRCKIVFRLEPDGDGDIDDDDTQMPQMGWEHQGKEFVFHDVITHQEIERLERYARKREQSSRPCPKSRQRCFSAGDTRSSKSDSTNNAKILQQLSHPDVVKETVEDMRILSKAVNMVTNGIDPICISDNDGDKDKAISSCPIILESGRMDNAQVAENQIPLLYRCPYCLQPFPQAEALVKHLPIHIGRNMRGTPAVRESVNETPMPGIPDKMPKGTCCQVNLTRCDNLLKQLGLGLGCNKLTLTVANYPSEKNIETIGTSSVNEAKKDIGISANIETIQPTRHDRPCILRRRYKCYQCPQCKKSFKKEYNFQCHLLIHKGMKPHKCNVCQKTFSKRRDLNRHSLTHSGIKPHKCKICSKAFSQSVHLNRHLLSHSGLKPHKCNICPKTFSRPDRLKDHLLTHSGIKPHKCKICSKAFAQWDQLNRHSNTHSGLKPHKCNICPKTFSQRTHFNRHLLTHSGLQPHKCNFCPKAFSRRDHLNRHSLTHSRPKPHTCSNQFFLH